MIPNSFYPICVGIRARTYNLLCIMLFSIFFVPGLLLTFNLAAKRPASESPSTHVILGCVFMFVALLSSLGMKRMEHLAPSQRIDGNGITFKRWGKSSFVSYKQISSVKAVYLKGRYVSLGLFEGTSVNRNFGESFNIMVGFGQVSFSCFGSGFSTNDVVRTIEFFMAAAAMR